MEYFPSHYTLLTLIVSRYRWIIPVPGFWHLEWHVQKGIYRLCGCWVLTPLAYLLGRTHGEIDRHSEVKNFRVTDEFLSDFATAVILYVNDLMAESSCHTVTEFLELIRLNDNLYDIVYITFYFIVPYTQIRRAIRHGDHALLESLLPLLVSLFYITGKTKYVRLLVTYLRTLRSLPQAWADAVRCATLTHIAPNSYCSPVDSFVEYINLGAKESMPPLRDRTRESIATTLGRLNITLPLKQQIEKELGVDCSAAGNSSGKMTSARSRDCNLILNKLRELFGEHWNRQSMTADTDHSPLFPDDGSTHWDTPNGESIWSTCETKMDRFDDNISSFVDRRLGAIFGAAVQQPVPAPNAAAAADDYVEAVYAATDDDHNQLCAHEDLDNIDEHDLH